MHSFNFQVLNSLLFKWQLELFYFQKTHQKETDDQCRKKSKSNTKTWAVRTGHRKEHVLLGKVLYFE